MCVCVCVCVCVFSYLKSIPILGEEQMADDTQLEVVLTREFIGKQLILLVGCLDTAEEGGRSAHTAAPCHQYSKTLLSDF